MEVVTAPILDQLENCHHRLNIEFTDLGYSFAQRKGTKSTRGTILKGINGSFKSGHLTGILGASGAGKTTLLNILSGFRTHGVTGTILINGNERNVSQFKKSCCYITQDYAMLSYLTTEETLILAADLKLGTHVKKAMKRSLVNQVLQALGLHKVKGSIVKNLSGGEQKRLSIGVELLTNPPVMFFDEPTSGLDSVSSLQIMTYLKSLAQSGRTVICSIHQPSSSIFEMFDDIYLLAEGQCLYSGPLDDLTTVFEEEGFTCPKYYNRADFAIEVACKQRGNIENLIMRLKKQHVTSDYVTMDTVDRDEKTTREDTAITMLVVENSKQLYEYSASACYQFLVLTKRSLICQMRDPFFGLLRVLAHLFVATLLGILCYDIGNDAAKVPTNISIIFFFILFLFVLGPAATLLCFQLETSVFLQEHKNNWYSLKSYVLSKLIADLPSQLVCSTLFIFVTYFMTGQPSDGMRPLKIWILTVLVSILAQSVSFAIGSGFELKKGLFVYFSLNLPMVLFSGFFLRPKDIVGYLQFVKELSYFRYAFDIAMVIVYGDRSSLECSEIYCYFKQPSKLLEDFGINEENIQWNFIAILIWIIASQISFFFILKWRIYKSH